MDVGEFVVLVGDIVGIVGDCVTMIVGGSVAGWFVAPMHGAL